jgi:competence protein ComEA
MKIVFLFLIVCSFVFGAVDINSASKKELMSVNGIGAKKADAIIAYRDVNCFASVDELTKVKGIGKKFVELNRANLFVGECTPKK